MSDEFIFLSGSADRPIGTRRRNVRLFLLGDPEDVEQTIAELHTKQFGEVNLWSKPLKFTEIQNEFLLQPGEVMRVYKRYLTR
jgi:hypothetical protein